MMVFTLRYTMRKYNLKTMNKTDAQPTDQTKTKTRKHTAKLVVGKKSGGNMNKKPSRK